MRVVEQKAELIWATPDPEKMIEIAGRTCYLSEDKITDDSSSKFVDKIRVNGHHAMIEFADACIRFTTDRGISHEIVRHRLASYAQVSTRYVNYSNKEMGFVEPLGLNEIQREIWMKSCKDSEKAYHKLRDQHCAPQVARDNLPTCLATEIVMKCNFREWRHFISLRGAPAAHPKIRVLAKMAYDILVDLAPNVFSDLEGVVAHVSTES
jgi:thymidylate synthase (FAD)